jgi:uroporphyrinogen-III synthase
VSTLKPSRWQPITSKTEEELGLRVDVVASEYTVEGLVRAIREIAGR